MDINGNDSDGIEEEERHEGVLSPREKKLSMRVLLFFWFLSGVEYAVIIPSVWEYLQSLQATEKYTLSIALSAFSFANFIASPAFGKMADVMSIKLIIMLSNLCEIGGNFLYGVANNPGMVYEGRFLAGLGAGSGSAVFAYVGRVTTESERTKAMGTLMASRPIGVLIGPAFNFLLVKISTNVGGFTINKLNVPGFFMVLVWIISQITFAIWFKDIPVKSKTDDSEESTEAASPGRSLVGGVGAVRTREYLNTPVYILLLMQFMVMFTQTALETFITPYTQEFFEWQQLANSVMFILLSVVTLIAFVGVQVLR